MKFANTYLEDKMEMVDQFSIGVYLFIHTYIQNLITTYYQQAIPNHLFQGKFQYTMGQKDKAQTGKKKLFGGMKIKGPSAKNEENKKSSNLTQSETNLGSTHKQQETQLKQVDKHTTQTYQKKQSEASQSVKNQKQQTGMQKNQKKHQPIQQYNAQPKQSKNSASDQLENDPECVQNRKQEIDRHVEKKIVKSPNHVSAGVEFKKTRSQRNYNPSKSDPDEEAYNDQRNQDMEVRQDRSEIIVNTSKEDRQFAKRKPSGANIDKKNNPFLNNIRKPSKTTVGKQSSVQASESKKRKQSTRPQPPIVITISNQKSQKQKESIMQQISRSHERILKNILSKKQAKQQIINLSNSISNLQEQHSVLLNKQNHHIAAEQYDKADELQQQIVRIVQKIAEQQIEINFTQQSFYKLEYQFLQILKDNYQNDKKMIRQIKLVDLQLNNDLSQYKRKQEEIIENEKVLNSNENKKIHRMENDIKSQTDQLQSYEKTFYDDLNSRRKPLQSSMQQQNLKKKALQQQIKQLQAKLAKKKNLLKSTVNNIETIKQKIQQVDYTFQEEKVKLDERKSSLKNLQEQKQLMHTRLASMIKHVQQLEKAKQSEIKKIQAEKSLLKRISLKLENSCLSSETDDIIQNKKVKIDNFIHSSKQLKEFEQKHKSEKEKVKQLEFKKSNILSQVNKSEDRIKQLKARIPKLQSEQKQMSMSKNFKGAGMKKNEIKQCNEQINEIKKTIQNSFASQAEIDAEIADIMKQQEQYSQQQNQIRKNLAINQYKLACEKVVQILHEIDWIKNLQSSNISKTSTLKNKYLSILQQELESVKQEVEYIAEEYQLSKPSFQLKTEEVQSNESESKDNLQNQKQITQNQQQSNHQTITEKDKEDQIKDNYSPPQMHKEDDEKNQKSSHNEHDEEEAQQQSSVNKKQQQLSNDQNQDEKQIQKHQKQQSPNQSKDEENDEEHQNKNDSDNQNQDDGGYVPLQLD